MAERKAVARETIRRYRRADRRGRTAILNEFVSTTELSRKYAIQLLKGTLRVRLHPPGAGPRGRPPRYGPAVKRMLTRLWAMFGFMCGNRLACAIRINLAVLEKFDELQGLTPSIRQRLLTISPATIDRQLLVSLLPFPVKGLSDNGGEFINRNLYTWCQLNKVAFTRSRVAVSTLLSTGASKLIGQLISSILPQNFKTP